VERALGLKHLSRPPRVTLSAVRNLARAEALLAERRGKARRSEGSSPCLDAARGKPHTNPMGAVPFDTLALARKLEAAGFDPKQAQDTAAALAEVLSEQVATRHDINELRAELRELEQRLVIKLGGMIAAAVAVVAILVKLL
jgi:hypothetical protein